MKLSIWFTTTWFVTTALASCGVVTLIVPSAGLASASSPLDSVAIPVDQYELREIAVGGGAVWVVGPDAVVRVDPATSAVTDTIEVPGARGIAATDEAVWVGSTRGATVRIDPATATVVAEIPSAGAAVDGIGADQSSAWVASQGTLQAIDTATNTVVREIPIAGEFPKVAVGSTAVWVSPGDFDNGQLQRVDVVTGDVTQIEVGGTLGSVAGTNEDAWVVRDDSEVCRVNDSAGETAGCAGIGIDGIDQEIGAIASGDDVIWVSVRGDAFTGEVYEIIGLEPDTLEIVAEFDIPVGDLSIFDIAAGDGAVYLSNDIGDTSTVIAIVP